MASGVRLPDLHCAFQGCHECWDFSVDGFPKGSHLHWGLEWCLFVHLIRKHVDAFAPELEAYGMHSTPNGVPTNIPKECPREYHTAQSKLQCDLFLKVHSVYMAAVCERERESMPVVGVAKDRQILRRLNAVLPKVHSMMCFGCAQIHSYVPMWQRMYEPGQYGQHREPAKDEKEDEDEERLLSRDSIQE